MQCYYMCDIEGCDVSLAKQFYFDLGYYDCSTCIYHSSLKDNDMPCLLCSNNDDTPCGGLPISEE